MPFLEKTEVDFSMENKDSKAIPIQNTLLTGILLALVGGFLDAYTYLFRGGVFANAQTGNMVLLAVYTAKGDFLKGVYYLIPIVAFFFGVLATEWIKNKVTSAKFTAWEHIVVFLEAVLLLIIGFLPSEIPDVIVNVTVSFVCSMQVNSFRKSGDMPYATTMCTGNLRSAAEKFFLYTNGKKKEAGRCCLNYMIIILAFCIGASAGGLLTDLFGGRSVWICCAVLLLVFYRIVHFSK